MMGIRTWIWAAWFMAGTAVWAQPTTALLHIRPDQDSVVVAKAPGEWQDAGPGAELEDGSVVRVVRGTAQVFYPSGDVMRLSEGTEHEVTIRANEGDDWTAALGRGWKALAGAMGRVFGATDGERVENVVVQGSARGLDESGPPVLATPPQGPFTLLSPHPRFTWYPSGAHRYRITVTTAGPQCEAGGKDVFTVTQADTSWIYPADAPALEPGETYWLSVTESTGRRQDRACFRQADLAQRDSAAIEVQDVRRMMEAGLSENERTEEDVVVALYLAERGYPIDGLMMLDSLLLARPDFAAALRARHLVLAGSGMLEKLRRRR